MLPTLQPLLSRYLLAILVLSTFLTACKDVKSPTPTQFAPQAPLKTQASFVNIPISYPYAELELAINRKLRKHIFKDPSFEDDRTKILVERGDKITISRINDEQKIGFKVPIKVQVIKAKPPKILGIKMPEGRVKELDFEAIVHISTPVSLSTNWQLETKSSIDKIEWIKKPKVKVGPFNIGIKRRVEKLFLDENSELPSTIDSVISEKVHIDEQVQKTWTRLHKPIKINEKWQEVWLHPKPLSLALTPLYLTPYEISSMVKCELNIEASSQETAAFAVSPLPNWTPKTDESTGYSLRVNYRIEYSTLTKALKDQLVDKPLKVSDQNIVIKDLEAKGNGSLLNLKLQLKGDIDGVVYVEGKPRIDTTKQELVFDDVDFNLKTQKTLLQVADWLLHDDFKQQIQDRARLSLASFSEIEPALLENAVANSKAGKSIKLHAETMQLLLKDIALTQTHLELGLMATGSFSLEVQKQRRLSS